MSWRPRRRNGAACVRARCVGLELVQKSSLAQFGAVLVQQQRIFERAAREQPLGQAREEDRVEGAAASFVDGARRTRGHNDAAADRCAAIPVFPRARRTLRRAMPGPLRPSVQARSRRRARIRDGARPFAPRSDKAIQPFAPAARLAGRESRMSIKGSAKCSRRVSCSMRRSMCGRCGLVFFLEIAELGLQFGAQSAQAARPAMRGRRSPPRPPEVFPSRWGRPAWFRRRNRCAVPGRRGRRAREIAENFVVRRNPLRDWFNRRAVLIDAAGAVPGTNIRRSGTPNSRRPRRRAAREKRGRRDRDGRRHG